MKKILLPFSVMLLVLMLACKKQDTSLNELKPAKISAIAKPEDKRIQLGTTNLSLISDFKFDFDEAFSTIAKEEEGLYKSKEVYTHMSKYCEIAISHNILADTSKFSIRKAIEASITNFQNATNTTVSDRVDINMSDQFAHPSTLSKGNLISKEPNGNNYVYRTAIIFTGEDAYFIIGIFIETYKDGIDTFDNMFKTIQIKS